MDIGVYQAREARDTALTCWPSFVPELDIGQLRDLTRLDAEALVNQLVSTLPSTGPHDLSDRLAFITHVIRVTGASPNAQAIQTLAERLQHEADLAATSGPLRDMLALLMNTVGGQRLAAKPTTPVQAIEAQHPLSNEDVERLLRDHDAEARLGGAGIDFKDDVDFERDVEKLIREGGTERGQRLRHEPAGTRQLRNTGADGSPIVGPIPDDAEDGEQPQQGGAEPTAPQDTRRWRADLEDHPAGTPLSLGQRYTVAFSVDDDLKGALAGANFAQIGRMLDQAGEVANLNVTLFSTDFEIDGSDTRVLRVPTGRKSTNKASFTVKPLNKGAAELRALIDIDRNLLAEIELTLPVDTPDVRPKMTVAGRHPDFAFSAQPRDLTIALEPHDDGYSCHVFEDVRWSTLIPVSKEQFVLASESVHSALAGVVLQLDDTGHRPYMSDDPIPESIAEQSLRTLANAGADLFSLIFFHEGATPKLTQLGEFLRTEAQDPRNHLKIDFHADLLPLPWALLYVGDASDNAKLDWRSFLGCGHIVEQVSDSTDRPRFSEKVITTEPQLSIELSVNQSISDKPATLELVTAHQNRWQDLTRLRPNLKIESTLTRDDVVQTLAHATTQAQILYFYCHCTPSGPEGNPEEAALLMSDDKSGSLTLNDLKRNDPLRTQLSGHPLVFINACDSADLTPRFYAGFIPYFVAKGARGIIGTEAKVPAEFAIRFAEVFFDRLLDGASVGGAMLATRQQFLIQEHNILGLIYAVHCDGDTRLAPALPLMNIPVKPNGQGGPT